MGLIGIRRYLFESKQIISIRWPCNLSTGKFLYLLFSHVSPLHPSAHVQVKDSPHAMHVPAFSQGFGMQTFDPANSWFLYLIPNVNIMKRHTTGDYYCRISTPKSRAKMYSRFEFPGLLLGWAEMRIDLNKTLNRTQTYAYIR